MLHSSRHVAIAAAVVAVLGAAAKAEAVAVAAAAAETDLAVLYLGRTAVLVSSPARAIAQKGCSKSWGTTVLLSKAG